MVARLELHSVDLMDTMMDIPMVNMLDTHWDRSMGEMTDEVMVHRMVHC